MRAVELYNREKEDFLATYLMASKSKNSLVGSSSAQKKKGRKESINDPYTCPICEEKIVEASKASSGQDAILCEGKCSSWLHKKCAGLSKSAFVAATKCDSPPFACMQCRLNHQESEITSLKSTISKLVENVEVLTSKLATLTTETPTDGNEDVAESPVETSATKKYTNDSKVMAQPKPKNGSSERKFNVVIHGISECPAGTPRLARVSKDLESVVSALSEIDPNIQSQSISDCFRLGQYKKAGHRSRPILVKMIRAADVTSLLMKRGSCSKSYLIKPDLSPEDHLSESIQLKKRWEIINSRIPKADIKLGRSSLYIKKSLHGRVVNGSYISQHTKSMPTNSKPTAQAITSPRSNDATHCGDLSHTSHIDATISAPLDSSPPVSD